MSDDTLPHRAINRVKTAVQMSGTLVVSWCGSTLYIMILRMGFIGEARFIAMRRMCAEQHMMEVVSAGRRELVHGRTAETNYINDSKHES